MELVAELVMMVGFGSGINGPLAENIIAQPVEICDRTEEVADSIIAEVQNTRSEAKYATVSASLRACRLSKLCVA